MQELSLCKICKEPINNFVCIDCFAWDLRKWLPSGLSASFSGFNRWLLDIFQYGHHTRVVSHHLVCSESNKGSICLYCYVNEVYQWLMRENRVVAKRFRRLFSFGMKGKEFGEIIKAHAEPISETDAIYEDLGICEDCGEYSEELKLVDGKWVCINCGSLENQAGAVHFLVM